jgi:hypothetical protein
MDRLVSPPLVGVQSFRLFQDYIFFLTYYVVILLQHNANGALSNV